MRGQRRDLRKKYSIVALGGQPEEWSAGVVEVESEKTKWSRRRLKKFIEEVDKEFEER